MSTSRSPKKTKRSYSLRNPRSARSPAFLDASAGFYDRLEELDNSGTYQAENPSESTDGGRASFSGHMGDPNGKSPLIAEEPKENQTKRKRRARSLRVTKTESRIFLVESSMFDDIDADTASQVESPKAPGKQPALGEAARVVCGPGMDDGQQLVEDLGETKEGNTEREKQKSNKMKQYKKTIDRAFRRGWETFMANLYTVSLPRSAASTADATPPLVRTC